MSAVKFLDTAFLDLIYLGVKDEGSAPDFEDIKNHRRIGNEAEFELHQVSLILFFIS